MTIFAISSSVPEVIVSPNWVLAWAKQQHRLARWWDQIPAHVVYTTRIGELDDPGAVDVHVVKDWSGHPDVNPLFVAFHDVEAGRPVCYVSWAAVQAEGGGLTGPGGLVEAISHELCEAAIDPDLDRLCTNPDGQQELIEVCDRIQGSPYEEDGSPGIWLANALGPGAFEYKTFRAAGLDIASDLRDPVVTTAFTTLPTGYYQPLDGPPHFGAEASEALRRRIEAGGGRAARKA